MTVQFKQKVYDQFQQLINEKISLIRHTLGELKESGANETKSTAGDKHETALAMLQIEQENARKQLKEALEQKALFDTVDITVEAKRISKGSLVKTSKGWLFMSVALGKIVVDGTLVIALSPQSPLGKKLVGLPPSGIAEVNGVTYIVEELI
ncbi:MAG TPA: hypothetical protein VFV68_17845 [Agriterribacter sp.]|nr:hypothetical protein [Agriterribacter sp.]